MCSVILSRLLASQPLVREKRAPTPTPLQCRLPSPAGQLCAILSVLSLEGRVYLVTARMELSLELLVWWPPRSSSVLACDLRSRAWLPLVFLLRE